jgi:hypothetical protein
VLRLSEDDRAFCERHVCLQAFSLLGDGAAGRAYIGEGNFQAGCTVCMEPLAGAAFAFCPRCLKAVCGRPNSAASCYARLLATSSGEVCPACRAGKLIVAGEEGQAGGGCGDLEEGLVEEGGSGVVAVPIEDLD